MGRDATGAGDGRDDPGRMPVDLDHLDRHTFGDLTLKRDVLTLFVRHSEDQVARLRRAGSSRERRELAHSIVGSARGIGAFPVAELARAIELDPDGDDGRMDALEAAADAARRFIAAFLGD